MTFPSLFSSSLLGRVLYLCLFVLVSCTHDPKEAKKKPHDFCFCGPMTDSDNKLYCAVWGDRKRLDTPHKAFAAKAQETCTPQDCSKLFSSKCAAMQMSAHPPINFPKPADQLCYCDSSLIENEKGQITLVCAAWMEGQKQLLEYYATKECRTETCKGPPFQLAQKLCPAGFKPFYERDKAITPGANP